MKQKYFFIFLLLIFLISSNTLFANAEQNESSQSQLAVQPVLTDLKNKERLISITIITKGDIKRCIGCDLTDILERAGVQVRRFHSDFPKSSDTDQAHVSLRGATETQTLLLVDGVRQEDSMRSEPVWTFIPLNHIERIEIVRGPQSAYYGDSAIGGVIHIFTEKADCAPGKLCTAAKVDHSNKPGTGSTIYGNINTRTDRSGFLLGIQGDKSKDRAKTGDYRETALNFNFDHRTADDDLLIEGSSTFYTSGNTGTPLPEIKRGSSGVASLGTTYYMSPDLLFKTVLGYNREEQFYSSDWREYQSQRISVKLLGQYDFEFANGNYSLTSGVEKQRESIGSQPDDIYDEHTQRDTEALFTNIIGETGPLTYQAAVRMDNLHGDIKEEVFTWKGNVSYHVGQLSAHNIFLRSGVGTGFRAPGFNEQHLEYFSPSEQKENRDRLHIGNPSLRLERSRTYEVGIRLERSNKYFLDISTFQTRLEGPIAIKQKQLVNIAAPGESPYYIHVIPTSQTDSLDVRGIELYGRFNMGPWSGKAQYTYTQSDDVHQFRAYNPVQHLASVAVDYAITPRLIAGAEVTHRGEREYEMIGTGDQISVLDIYSFYDFNDHIRFGASVRNLTDEEYDQYDHTTGPRRSVWLTFEITN